MTHCTSEIVKFECFKNQN